MQVPVNTREIFQNVLTVKVDMKKEVHLKNCKWHKDWHACSCGAFDYDQEQLAEQQDMETCFGVLYTGEEIINTKKGIIL